MKRLLLPLLLTAILGLTITVPSTNAAGTERENERLQQGKITKNEAQHLVLKQFPGAKINKCVLMPGKEHSVWVLEVVKAGATETTKVQVDGNSGKILP